MAREIFISYSRHDIGKVFPFVEQINKAAGVDCWIDLDGIESGEQFEDVIIDAIDECKVVLFMLSDSSLNSIWTKREVYYAEDGKKRIVPVLVDGEELRGWFKFHFGNVDYIDINKPEQIEKLVRNLKSWLGKKEIVEKTTVMDDTPVLSILKSLFGEKDVVKKTAIIDRPVLTTKKEVVELTKKIAHGEEVPKKEMIDYLKTSFYNLHLVERENQLKEYLDNGGDPELYQILPDEYEMVFKSELNYIMERRKQLAREIKAKKHGTL